MLFACWFLSHTQSTPGISDSASVEGGSVAVPDAFLCRFLSHTQGTPGISNSASVEGGNWPGHPRLVLLVELTQCW